MFLTWRYIRFVFLAQIAFAFLICPIFKISDLFPFFHWRLFARVYQFRETPLLYIHKIDGQQFEPPILFYDHFKKSGKDTVSQICNDLNSILEVSTRSPDSTARLVSVFNEKYFSNYKEIKYQIVLSKVDQLEFLLKKNILEPLRIIGEFEYKK